MDNCPWSANALEMEPGNRRLMSGYQGLSDRRRFVRRKEDLVFSLSNGFVWVSWPGTSACVKLGTHEAVSDVMRNFLATNEIAKRLEDPRAGEN